MLGTIVLIFGILTLIGFLMPVFAFLAKAIYAVYLISYFLLCVLTYPITLIIRLCGLKHRSLFAIWAAGWKSFNQQMEQEKITKIREIEYYRVTKSLPPMYTYEKAKELGEDYLVIYNSLVQSGEVAPIGGRPKENRTESEKGQANTSSKSSHKEEERFDPYTILGVPRGAPREAIKQAYRSAMSKNHPDRVASLDDAFKALAHRRALEIQRAYEALANE